MACNGCNHPMHEQYKNYPGHWYCFHPKTCGKTICHTPKEDYDNFDAHRQVLEEAKDPKWCPLKSKK